MSRKIYFIAMILSVFLLISFTSEITARAQSVVSINNVEGLPGDTVEVQVSIDDVTGAQGIDTTIAYDSTAVVSKSVSSGGLIPSGWSLTPNDKGNGILKVALFGTTPLSGGGALLNISFTIKPDAAVDTYPLTLGCLINEGAIETTLVNGSITVLPVGTTTTSTTLGTNTTTTTTTTTTSTTTTSTTLSTSSTSTTTTSTTLSTSSTSTTTTSTTLSTSTTTTTTNTTTTTIICGENPEILSLTPRKGPYGRDITIKGSDFCDETGNVFFIKGSKKVKASESDIINWNDTEIVVSVPWGCKPGFNKVKIFTAANSKSNTKPLNFIKRIPRITSTSLQSGQIGSEIVITGKNYGKQDKKSRVLFGNVRADISEWNDDNITVIVPDVFLIKKGKTVSVKVITRYGASNGKKFKVLKAQ